MIRIGIVGYGNLSRAAIDNIQNFPDMEIVAIFTRRPQSVTAKYAVYGMSELESFKDKIDVLLLCGGSATDLPEHTPLAAQWYNVVDSFDTHKNIPMHLKKVHEILLKSGKTGVISVGWDPGLFSIARAYFNAFLPVNSDYTFWGKGVSQGHSDAVRRIDGVLKAVQYTVPKEDAVAAAQDGSNPSLSTRQKHMRECFVVPKEGANTDEIRRQIVQMPNYFADYDTVVHFITLNEFEEKHLNMPHGGQVIYSGKSANSFNNVLKLGIQLDSNPHFTSGIMLCYARAIYRMHQEGIVGCFTALDIPVSKLAAEDREQLLLKLL